MIWLGLYRKFSTPKIFCDEKKICEDSKIHEMSLNPGTKAPRKGFSDISWIFKSSHIFFRRRKISGSKIFYTNPIISSEKLFSMHRLVGMLRDPAVPALDFREKSVFLMISYCKKVPFLEVPNLRWQVNYCSLVWSMFVLFQKHFCQISKILLLFHR